MLRRKVLITTRENPLRLAAARSFRYVQFVSVDLDGRPGDRGGRIDFQYLFGIKDLIGIFRLGAGEALCRRLRRTCGIGHAQTAERRHAVELQRQIHALCITVRTGLAGSERNRIARRAADFQRLRRGFRCELLCVYADRPYRNRAGAGQLS